ncbi:hypothetical protein MMP61_02875 [Acinetobacter sp. NIPH 1958]|uniref:hypothetical protein n=1 Tax=unclassified Acinetobacter TaxID=196816 RepID=UPI001F4B8B4A|nr:MULTISPECIES: hypothetical protein [unclassified Acinetobacter]MCH7351977.1 hypothetical protein [Acinetobacter sp. NIPH 2023]MCH7354533.1 hypothetical protein [Acinetobacter sp. NIPH 1958]MCH7359655.1 hypothetical protein [Acinetobacter sp. NIPH 2024]
MLSNNIREYVPYVKLKTEVDITKLSYTLSIFDTVNQKYKNSDYNVKYLFKKSGSNFRTAMITLKNNRSRVEVLKDYVLIFNLYRSDNSGNWHHVIKNYYVNNMIEEFEKSVVENVKLDIIKYSEKNDATKVVQPKNPNTVVVNISTTPIFVSVEHPPGSKKDPFTKEAVEASLFSRLKEPYPDQRFTYLCGPAAFFYCVLNSNKEIYKKIVKALWEKGEVLIGRLSIKPDLKGARLVHNFYDDKEVARISAVDWITMGSLRDSSNSVTKYNQAEAVGWISDKLNGLTAFTMPDEIKNWFSSIGYSVPLYQSFIRQKVPRNVDWLDVLRSLSSYPSQDYYYVLLTVGAITQGGSDLPSVAIGPSHYIVINSDLKTDTGVVNKLTSDDTIVNATCFNWGKQDRIKSVSLKTLSRFIWAIIVVKRELK